MNLHNIGETYRQIGSQGADPLEMVVLLYDVLLDDLRRAIEALRAHDIEKRTAEIQHALRVLEQLQGSLDLDRGGDPAHNLDQLYAAVRGKLIEAHWKASEDLLQRQLNLLMPVRDAWQEARMREMPQREAPLPDMPPPGSEIPSVEWRV